MLDEQGKKEIRDSVIEVIAVVALNVIASHLPPPFPQAISTACVLYMAWSLFKLIRKHRKERNER